MTDPAQVNILFEAIKYGSPLVGVAFGVVGTLVTGHFSSKDALEKEKLVQAATKDREELAHKRSEASKRREGDLERLESLFILIDQIFQDFTAYLSMMRNYNPDQPANEFLVFQSRDSQLKRDEIKIKAVALFWLHFQVFAKDFSLLTSSMSIPPEMQKFVDDKRLPTDQEQKDLVA
ncbi:MAG: hypothetical protein QNL04_00275, partial [SAR324 cluster bacterium]|nr:hypothetical protein [SAR324 cluster bacterium]